MSFMAITSLLLDEAINQLLVFQSNSYKKRVDENQKTV